MSGAANREALIAALAGVVALKRPYYNDEQIQAEAAKLATTGAYSLLPGGGLRPNIADPGACAAAARTSSAVAQHIASAAFPAGQAGDLQSLCARMVATGCDPLTMSAYQAPVELNSPEDLARALGL